MNILWSLFLPILTYFILINISPIMIRKWRNIILSIRTRKKACMQKFTREDAVMIDGELTEENDTDIHVIRALKFFENDSSLSTIIIQLNSKGGDRDVAMNICRTMKRCKKVIEVRAHKARSAAVLILVNGTKGRRFVYHNAKVAIHEPCVEDVSPIIGNLLTAGQLKLIVWLYGWFLSKKTGQSLRKILKDMKNKREFSAQEAVAYGFADSVITRGDN
ncbi:ATP-dependent Clp protease proteolytic subunit [Patescibacteria group bacterium AH-259-L05]|nr:ATP-dependent Clp protease proteolytic subunit [Patescibacteria group bacterium AH-259-L05]